MPSRNIIREYAPHAYYHIYNRGVNKRLIYIDEQDYDVFLRILRRHLSHAKYADSFGRDYAKFYDDIELVAYCLMPNHFHLLIYQLDNPQAMTVLMRSVATAYTMYFNKKYRRVGHLFQSRFKASMIFDDSYLLHISRYIHLNPKEYKTYKWSSLSYYRGSDAADWIIPSRALQLFEPGKYLSFLSDYEGYKQMLKQLKYQLADN